MIESRNNILHSQLYFTGQSACQFIFKAGYLRGFIKLSQYLVLQNNHRHIDINKMRRLIYIHSAVIHGLVMEFQYFVSFWVFEAGSDKGPHLKVTVESASINRDMSYKSTGNHDYVCLEIHRRLHKEDSSPSKIWSCVDKCGKTFHAAWMTFEKEGGKDQW